MGLKEMNWFPLGPKKISYFLKSVTILRSGVQFTLYGASLLLIGTDRHKKDADNAGSLKTLVWQGIFDQGTATYWQFDKS